MLIHRFRDPKFPREKKKKKRSTPLTYLAATHTPAPCSHDFRHLSSKAPNTPQEAFSAALQPKTPSAFAQALAHAHTPGTLDNPPSKILEPTTPLTIPCKLKHSLELACEDAIHIRTDTWLFGLG